MSKHTIQKIDQILNSIERLEGDVNFLNRNLEDEAIDNLMMALSFLEDAQLCFEADQAARDLDLHEIGDRI